VPSTFEEMANPVEELLPAVLAEQEADPKTDPAADAQGEDEDVAAEESTIGEDDKDDGSAVLVTESIAPSVTRDPAGTGAPLARLIPTPHVTRKGEVGGESLAEIEVKSPADLRRSAAPRGSRSRR